MTFSLKTQETNTILSFGDPNRPVTVTFSEPDGDYVETNQININADAARLTPQQREQTAHTLNSDAFREATGMPSREDRMGAVSFQVDDAKLRAGLDLGDSVKAGALGATLRMLGEKGVISAEDLSQAMEALPKHFSFEKDIPAVQAPAAAKAAQKSADPDVTFAFMQADDGSHIMRADLKNLHLDGDAQGKAVYALAGDPTRERMGLGSNENQRSAVKITGGLGASSVLQASYDMGDAHQPAAGVQVLSALLDNGIIDKQQAADAFVGLRDQVKNNLKVLPVKEAVTTYKQQVAGTGLFGEGFDEKTHLADVIVGAAEKNGIPKGMEKLVAECQVQLAANEGALKEFAAISQSHATLPTPGRVATPQVAKAPPAAAQGR